MANVNISYVAADAPAYRNGHTVLIALNCLSFVCSFPLEFVTDR